MTNQGTPPSQLKDISFTSYDQLSYKDYLDDSIMLYVENTHVGDTQVLVDDENTKYIVINEEAIRLNHINKFNYKDYKYVSRRSI